MSELNTRTRLIDAAFAVVARDGLEAASVKTIASEAGITAGLLHYHFPSKDALLEAALRRALDDYVALARARREKHAPENLLEAFLADARTSVDDDADFFRVRLAFAARALSDPGLSRTFRALTAVAVEETAITLAAAAGRSEVTATDRTRAAALKAGFDGLMLAYLNDPAFPIVDAGTLLFDAVTRPLEA